MKQQQQQAASKVEGIEPRYVCGGWVVVYLAALLPVVWVVGVGCVYGRPCPQLCRSMQNAERDRYLPAYLSGEVQVQYRQGRTHKTPWPHASMPPPFHPKGPTRPQPHASSSQQPALISHQLEVSDAVSWRAPAGSSASGSGCKPGRGQEQLTELWLIRGALRDLGGWVLRSVRSSTGLVCSVPGRLTDAVWC